jgi:hypothetical protein
MKNKKVQKLAEQAGLYVDVDGEPWTKWLGAESADAAYAQFAELIIRDCAKQVNNVYMQGGGTYGEKILKHFNIKP